MSVAVIIPCFNDGVFLTDAVTSVMACKSIDIELIIVDDGSTDLKTINILEEYKTMGITVLSHQNKGLAYSRNKGIAHTSAKYILPLDADNKITEKYITVGVSILESGTHDIVYAKPVFFGDGDFNSRFDTHEFDGEKLFVANYIDACAIFCKTVWEEVGGYDENMPYQGNEDWEFWLHSYLRGFRFKFLNDGLFGYRIRQDSMISSVSVDKTNAVKNYMINKHVDSYRKHIEILNTFRLFYNNDQFSYRRTAIKYLIKAIKNFLRFKTSSL